MIRIKNFRVKKELIVGYFPSTQFNIIVELKYENKREQHTLILTNIEERDGILDLLDELFKPTYIF